MKKILLAFSSIVSNICMASPTSYDLSIYNDFISSFWQHNYHTVNRDLKTHTGRDYQVGNNWEHVNIYSYGFGKMVGRTTNFGAVTIRNLLNNGRYVKVNLLHMQNNSISLRNNQYISKYQFLGKEGNTGLGQTNLTSNVHLHFEVAGQISLAWISSSRACPGTGCPTEITQRTTAYDIGSLKAHYQINSTRERNIPLNNRVWYDPGVFMTYNELLPFLSRQDNTPSYNNFDIYGISNKTIYGHLNINATGLSKVGILVRGSKSRSDAEHSSASYNAQKFLAESSTDFNGLDGNSDKYIKGDYLFVPYVNQNEHRYGYPIKFSFVDEGSFIIDNDKTTYSNGASYSETLSNTVNSDKNNVPGYFLTSKLIKVTANNFNDFAKWSVPSATDGEYHLYAHIPKGATASDCTYTIRTTDGDKTKSIEQSSMTKEDWADLGTYSLNSDGYVKLSLRNDNNGEWMAFDAIKFEKVSSGTSKGNTFNGTGSIVAPYKNRTIGGDQDVVALQEGDNSMGSFQWLQYEGYCPNLLIKNDEFTNEVDDVLIVRKRWDSSTVESFETTLPITLPSNITSSRGYNFDTILIKSLTSLSKLNNIRAICKNTVTNSSKTNINTPNIVTKDGYKWTGNGSIISQELDGTGFGKTKDVVLRYKAEKSLSIFQWQPSSRCKKLEISAGLNGGKSFNGKLSVKKWSSITYTKNKIEKSFPYTLHGDSGEFYMIEIRTDKNFVQSKYIYAECTE